MRLQANAVIQRHRLVSQTWSSQSKTITTQECVRQDWDKNINNTSETLHELASCFWSVWTQTCSSSQKCSTAHTSVSQTQCSRQVTYIRHHKLTAYLSHSKGPRIFHTFTDSSKVTHLQNANESSKIYMKTVQLLLPYSDRTIPC